MDCVIVGAGGHGRVVLDIIRQQGRYRAVGFLDSDPDLRGTSNDGIEVLGSLQLLPSLQRRGVHQVIIAIGDNRTRRCFAEQARDSGLQLINAIHPSANIAESAALGCGVVVAAGALVCAHCRIGDCCILNTGCLIDHESVIGPASHICPGVRIAGRVVVESGAFVGIGATVIQHVRIGRDAVVGAGAVVLDAVAAEQTVVGLPARPISDRCSSPALGH